MESTGLIDALRAWGCDTDGALRRLCGDSGLYVELLNEYLDELDVGRLERAAAAGDIQGAFDIAHSIKGVTGNLGLTPLYRAACQVTEAFRGGGKGGYEEALSELVVRAAELRTKFPEKQLPADRL